jgi:lysophospholipase L1-like esterase
MLNPGWKIASTAPLAALLLGFGLAASLPVATRADPVAAGSGRHAAVGDLNAVFAGQPCVALKDLAQLDAPIARLAKRMTAQEPVTIVAVGSSSTGGAGASSPAFSYPSRLERELRERFPHTPISVVNKGVNGEEVADMMARMDSILALKPDLVIWQLGTNTVLRDGSVSSTEKLLQAGLDRIRDSGADVLLVDPQFAPLVNAKPSVHAMVDMIGFTAKRRHVPLFRRYVAMRHWHEDQAIAVDHFITPDGLHMNDWGYSCFARLMADNIATTIMRSRAVADVKPLPAP